MTTKQSTRKQSSAKSTATRDLMNLLMDDCMGSVEAIPKKFSHHLSVKRFMELLKDLITDETKSIQVFFDEVHDNNKFNPVSKSKYVRVLMYCIQSNGSKVTGIDWRQLHKLIPGFQYLILNRADGATDGKFNMVQIEVKQQNSRAGFSFHEHTAFHFLVDQSNLEKMVTKYNEHFNITPVENLADVDHSSLSHSILPHFSILCYITPLSGLPISRL